jgi:hypothetical protein
MLVRSFRRSCALAMKAISFTVLILVQGAVCGEPVKVESGLVQGTVEDGLFLYRGIPYAAPPLGNLRWRAPQPAPKWQGARAANEFGRACIQSNPAIANLPAPSEDCLYLNVWTPAKSVEQRLPVMVWIHGGGCYSGTALPRRASCQEGRSCGYDRVPSWDSRFSGSPGLERRE